MNILSLAQKEFKGGCLLYTQDGSLWVRVDNTQKSLAFRLCPSSFHEEVALNTRITLAQLAKLVDNSTNYTARATLTTARETIVVDHADVTRQPSLLLPANNFVLPRGFGKVYQRLAHTTDTNRPALNAIWVEKGWAYSADGYSCQRHACDCPLDIILPYSVLMGKLLQDDQDIDGHWAGGFIQLKTPDWWYNEAISDAIIPGDLPRRIESLIADPKPAAHIRVERAQLKAALKTMLTRRHFGASFTFQGGNSLVISQTGGNHTGSYSIPAIIANNGDTVTFTMTDHTMSSLLKILGDSPTKVSLFIPPHPALFRIDDTLWIMPAARGGGQ